MTIIEAAAELLDMVVKAEIIHDETIAELRARAERAEAALVESASSSLRLREELADVYRRAERAEAALAERDKPCVWRYKRYGGWFSTCGVRPANWNTAWRHCPFCGHPLHAPSHNDLLSPDAGTEAGAA